MYDVFMTLFVTAFFVLVAARMWLNYRRRMRRSMVPQAIAKRLGHTDRAEGALGARKGGGGGAAQARQVREADAGGSAVGHRDATRAAPERRPSRLGSCLGHRFLRETAAQNIFITIDTPQTNYLH